MKKIFLVLCCFCILFSCFSLTIYADNYTQVFSESIHFQPIILEDENLPDFDIYVWFNITHSITYGDSVTIYSSISDNGFYKDNPMYELRYQWQVSYDDGITYEDISNETNTTYTFIVTEENVNNYYRVMVTVWKYID